MTGWFYILITVLKSFKAIYPGIYSIIPFDDSYGNDRGREYGLNVTRMNIVYVVVQQVMHITNIKQEVGCLGLHEQNIEVED